MARPSFQTVDDYIAAQPAPARPVLARVRATIRRALPGATEGIAYQIPVYKLGGAMVLYFAGFQRHYSILPATAQLVGALKKELAGFLHGKATLRFPYAGGVPARLITRIAKLRAAEAAARVRLAKPRAKKIRSPRPAKRGEG